MPVSQFSLWLPSTPRAGCHFWGWGGQDPRAPLGHFVLGRASASASRLSWVELVWGWRPFCWGGQWHGKGNGEGAERPRVTSEHYWWKMAGAFLCLGPGANCWLQLAGAKLAQQVCRRGEVADGSPRLLLSSAARFFNSVGTFNLLISHFAIQSKEYRLHLGGGNFMNCCAVYCTFSAFRNLWVFFWTSLQSLLKKYL